MTNNSNFAKLFEEIESINAWFQQDNIDLEEAFLKYKRGLELVTLCKKRLAAFENEIIELKEQATEGREGKEFPVDDNIQSSSDNLPF